MVLAIGENMGKYKKIQIQIQKSSVTADEGCIGRERWKWWHGCFIWVSYYSWFGSFIRLHAIWAVKKSYSDIYVLQDGRKYIEIVW